MNDIKTFTKLINLAPQPQRLKVGICVPYPDIGWNEFSNIYADIWLESSLDFILQRINVNGSDIVSLRNIIVAAGWQYKVDYFMFLDSDMIIPKNVVQRLMAHKKDIVGATYVRRKPPYWTLGNPVSNIGAIETRHGTNSSPINHQNAGLIWNNTGLIEMEIMPFGCMLIKADVFECLEKPHFMHRYKVTPPEVPEPGHILSEDHTFCQRIREKGYKIWCDVDLSKEIGHLAVKPIFWNSPEAMGVIP